METLIEIKNLSKRYKIGSRREKYITLRDGLVNFFVHPIAAVKALKKNEFWALRNINLAVEKGEAIGIIGANGAGKSTLLKILSRITPPTGGEIKISGRVSSLLEVGTGFNSELTGRENIYLNGAILGMSKKEIESKMESIIEFSGVDKFIDTPIKHYSSGMSVRLAFSVAAHLDPDILIVDEVLAVGDADFQKKCLGKMDEVVKKSGRTILFVSHNMEAIRDLCPKCVLLKNGEISAVGATDEVINAYLDAGAGDRENGRKIDFTAPATDGFRLYSYEIKSEKNNFGPLRSSAPIIVEIKFELEKIINNLCVGFGLYNKHNILIFRSYNTDADEEKQPRLKIGKNTLRFVIPGGLLNAGTYYLAPSIDIANVKWLMNDELKQNRIFFDVYFDHSNSKIMSTINSYPLSHPGAICPILEVTNTAE